MKAEMGNVASLWRYPVKSTQGEELSEGEITQHGLLGDRAYALIDVAEGNATTATLNTLHEAYPKGRFEPRRFRPHVLIDTPDRTKGFVEESWIGKTVKIGDAQLAITGACGRCVMTTLAQGDLPKDNGILRTAVQHNEGHVRVYAKVLQSGAIKRGDRLIALG